MRGSCEHYRYRVTKVDESNCVVTLLCCNMREISDFTGMKGRGTIKKHILNPSRFTDRRFRGVKIFLINKLPKFEVKKKCITVKTPINY